MAVKCSMDKLNYQAAEIAGSHYQHGMQFSAVASICKYIKRSLCWMEFYSLLIRELQHNPWSDYVYVYTMALYMTYTLIYNTKFGTKCPMVQHNHSCCLLMPNL